MTSIFERDRSEPSCVFNFLFIKITKYLERTWILLFNLPAAKIVFQPWLATSTASSCMKIPRWNACGKRFPWLCNLPEWFSLNLMMISPVKSAKIKLCALTSLVCRSKCYNVIQSSCASELCKFTAIVHHRQHPLILKRDDSAFQQPNQLYGLEWSSWRNHLIFSHSSLSENSVYHPNGSSSSLVQALGILERNSCSAYTQ